MVPRLLLITDHRSAHAAGHEHRAALAEAIGAGVDAVLLRDRDLAPERRRALGEWLAATLATTHTALVVAGDPRLAHHLGAVGLHLAVRDPWPDPTTWDGPVSRSVHDDPQAAHEGDAAFVLAAPVAPTASKPGYGPALGETGLRRLVAAAGTTPVLALGGVIADDVDRWCDAGAAGVAVMGGVLRARAPGDAVRALRRALDAARPRATRRGPRPAPPPPPAPDPHASRIP
ncbi:MAG: thiamine phosphate synthase [Nitriliruptoraceae bacterium]|nr:thiamine phosphate synthase [Nitriliruptoraceae bacterium]